MNLIFSLPWIQLFWIFTLNVCRAQVMITTQPSDVAVPAGGEAVFTCVVQVDENIIDDDVRWNHMGNNITVMSTDPYMVTYEVTNGLRLLTSTLTITNVRMEHAGPYKFVLINTRGGDVISETAVLTVLAATITTQPSDVTVCTGGVAVFTCVVDRNGTTNITSDDVMWQQIRPEGSTSTLSTSLGGLPFIIITTISGDILNSTLTVRGVAVGNALGTSLYRCVIPVGNMKSRNASLQFSAGPPGTPMNIRFSDITNTSFVVQWDEVDDVDLYIVNWSDDGGNARESTISRTSTTITQLSPNTTYNVTVTAISCGKIGTSSGTFTVTTNIWNAIQLTSISTIMLQQSTSSVMEQSITSSTHFPTQSNRMKSDSSSLSTGVAVAVTFTITFIITLTVSVVITFLITFVIVKRKFEKIYKTTHQPTQQMPLYDTVITPAITKSDVKLEANPAYSTSDRVVMDNNPAYQSCK